jgi:hypothetical protein
MPVVSYRSWSHFTEKGQGIQSKADKEPVGRDKTGAWCYSDDARHRGAFTGYREKEAEAIQWRSVNGKDAG